MESYQFSVRPQLYFRLFVSLVESLTQKILVAWPDFVTTSFLHFCGGDRWQSPKGLQFCPLKCPSLQLVTWDFPHLPFVRKKAEEICQDLEDACRVSGVQKVCLKLLIIPDSQCRMQIYYIFYGETPPWLRNRLLGGASTHNALQVWCRWQIGLRPHLCVLTLSM